MILYIVAAAQAADAGPEVATLVEHKLLELMPLGTDDERLAPVRVKITPADIYREFRRWRHVSRSGTGACNLGKGGKTTKGDKPYGRNRAARDHAPRVPRTGQRDRGRTRIECLLAEVCRAGIHG